MIIYKTRDMLKILTYQSAVVHKFFNSVHNEWQTNK